MTDEERIIFVLFMGRRFGHSFITVDYYKEWEERFKCTHPEIFMDLESRAIYNDVCKRQRGEK